MDWMAWTWPTAIFFIIIACILTGLHRSGDQVSRDAAHGDLGIETTRGDRLFITLLGSAFINLAWLGVVGANQPFALIVCLIYAASGFPLGVRGGGPKRQRAFGTATSKPDFHLGRKL